MKTLINEPDIILGGCPECGANDEYLNIQRTHICVCHEHKTAWVGGEDLIFWRGDDERDWEQNKLRLKEYCYVKPRYYQSDEHQNTVYEEMAEIEEKRELEHEDAIEQLLLAVSVLGLEDATQKMLDIHEPNADQAFRLIQTVLGSMGSAGI